MYYNGTLKKWHLEQANIDLIRQAIDNFDTRIASIKQ